LLWIFGGLVVAAGVGASFFGAGAGGIWLAGLGIFLLALASAWMAALREWPPALARWFLAAWAILIPGLTVPLTFLLLNGLFHPLLVPKTCDYVGPITSEVDGFHCPPATISLVLSPGALNVLPIAWLGVTDRRTRRVAVAAASFGAVRWVVPWIWHLVPALSPEAVNVFRTNSIALFGMTDLPGQGVTSLALYLVTVSIVLRVAIAGRIR
jgi:hypothetical protein